MSQLEAPAPGRSTAFWLLGFGAVAMAAGIALGPKSALAGAAIFVGLAILAMRELATPTITWANAVACFVLLMWLVPSKGYRLPVTLPFNLEPYRLVLAALLFVLVMALIGGRAKLRFLGFGAAVAVLASAATVSAILNYNDIGGDAGDPGAIKSLSYFLGFLAVFVLVAAVIRTHEQIDTVLRAFVVGAAIVAAAAIYESRSGYNAFDHLAEWFPVLIRESRAIFEGRGGNLRVYASAQHPIALSAALFMAFPLALYLVGRASSQLRARLWIVAAAVCAMGAVATISRTTVIMGVALAAVGLWLRRRQVIRFWPLLLVLPFAIHFAVPGALGGIYKAFFPAQGLGSDLYVRSGESGSGRFADIEPGIRLWEAAPLFGQGIGAQLTTGQAGASDPAASAEGAVLIFDNQWLNTLVATGFVGLVGALWFVWGSFGSIGRYARRVVGPRSDLAAACAAAICAFGVSMLVFDAFAFIQVTIFFFMIVALGLTARLQPADRSPSAGGSSRGATPGRPGP
jgi:hypothetical protein